MHQKPLNLAAVALLLLLVFAFLLAQGPSVAGAGSDNVNSTEPSPPVPPAANPLASALVPAGPFSFAEPTIRLAPGLKDGTGEIILRSSTKQSGPPIIKDVELPKPLAAIVTFEQIPDSNAPADTWRYRATVYGLALASSQQHYALVTAADNKTQYLLYTLTNQPAGSFSWSVSKLPDPWVSSKGPTADDGACTAFSVTAKDSSATNVTVNSTLVEEKTKKAITLDNLRLCISGKKCDGTEPITLQANVPTALQLCTTKTFHGNYHGAIVLASREKPDGDIILQNAQFSSFVAKLIGFVLILVGVALAFLAKVWARAKLERDQALVPVTVMRTQVNALAETLGQLKPEVYRKVPTKLNEAIKTLLGELSDSVLDSHQFLPPRVPNPFGFTVDAAGFKAYLEARNPRVQLLSILVNKGVVPAVREDNGTLPDGKKSDVEKAIQDIDAIVDTNTSADQALNQVQGIVENLHLKLFPPPDNVINAQLELVPATASTSFEALQLEIQSISKAIWVLYGILTAVSGLAFLILNNPGYGVPLDYIFALFWGFGLPMMVQSLAPSSAASALNISIAKG
ncbi:MAG TPA: hypothetical protein VF088_04390 [Pyrinomonadaceae bacterium]